MTYAARRTSVYIAARTGFNWLPTMVMAVIGLIWGVTKNVIQESGASLRVAETLQVVCVLYVQRAFIIFMAISFGVWAQTWWESQELAAREQENALGFWSDVLKKARWSVAIGVVNVIIAVFAAQPASQPSSMLTALFWIASLVTLTSAVVALIFSMRILQTLPAQGDV